MSLINSTFSTFLDLPPSCIEICPWNENYFVIGTYDLKKEDNTPRKSKSVAQERTGSVLVFFLNGDQTEFRLEQTFETDYAILDVHFPPTNNGERLFWSANSTGSLACYAVSDSGFLIHTLKLSQVWDKGILVLSFTFHPQDPRLLAVTLSDGSVAICHLSDDMASVQSTLVLVSHSLEAWTSTFSLQGEYIFSGADDAQLRCVKLLDLTDLEHASKPTHELEWSSLRHHTAGVTALLEINKDIIVTGSYDDRIRVFDIQARPKLLAEEDLKGGVWRLKSMQSVKGSGGIVSYDILASCMHAGVRVVRITLSKPPSITVLAKFEEHKSMNYGSDFTRRTHEDAILSTSFYDKRLFLWKYRAPEADTPTKLPD